MVHVCMLKGFQGGRLHEIPAKKLFCRQEEGCWIIDKRVGLGGGHLLVYNVAQLMSTKIYLKLHFMEPPSCLLFPTYPSCLLACTHPPVYFSPPIPPVYYSRTYPSCLVFPTIPIVDKPSPTFLSIIPHYPSCLLAPTHQSISSHPPYRLGAIHTPSCLLACTHPLVY